MSTKQDGRGRPQLDAPKGFAQRLRASREQAGLTMHELAKKLKVAYLTAHRWERGKHEPDLPSIKRIAKAVGVNWVWLLSGEGKADD